MLLRSVRVRSIVLKDSALLLAALLSAGCLVASLHPVYDDDSIVFDEALLGRWEIAESEITVVVARAEWRSYDISYTDRFGTTRFTGHLTRLGTARFLNVRPEDGVERPAFLMVTNGVLHVEVDAARVRVREPEYATVLTRMKSGKLGIDAAIDLKQNVIVTASTQKWRAWLLAALKDEEAWADWKTFTRRTP
jgi:hypothetical protein